MPKTAVRPYSRITAHALALLGREIRLARKVRKITTQELAQRAGVSRGLVQRIEKGDPGCQIGVVFEAAAIVGVPLFSADEHAIKTRERSVDERLALLPRHTHVTRKVHDAF